MLRHGRTVWGSRLTLAAGNLEKPRRRVALDEDPRIRPSPLTPVLGTRPACDHAVGNGFDVS